MSQVPPLYQRQNNFSSDALNPQLTLADTCADLDAEYEAIKSSVNQTISRLSEIQRDDGKLSAVVNVDSMTDDALALIGLNPSNIKGAWGAGAAYAVGDIVTSDGGTLLCVEAHTSGSDVANDLNDGRWVPIGIPNNNVVVVDRFTGDGVAVEFTLSSEGTTNGTNVFIDGVYQQKDSYTVSGSALTLGAAAPAGATIEVVIGLTRDTVIADGEVTTVKIADGSVTEAKIAPITATGTTESRNLQDRFADVINVKDFGAVGDGVADDTAAIQAAIDFAATDKKNVFIPASNNEYIVSSTLTIPQGVFVIGEGGWFKNQFTDNKFEVGGSALKLADGANTDMILFRYSPGVGETISDYRVHSGLKDIILFGNKSPLQAPSAATTNTSGNGIVISGARYVRLENVVVVKFAENGLSIKSYDYGSGAISSNNADIRACAFLSNKGIGAFLAGGDSIFTNNQVGYNGSTGISCVGFGVVSDNLVWNNQAAGVYLGTTTLPVNFTNNRVYDNKNSGIYIAGPAMVANNVVERNNDGANLIPSEQSGIFVSASDTYGITITGNSIGNDVGTDQEYGVYFNSSAARCKAFVGNNFYNNNTANVVLAHLDNIKNSGDPLEYQRDFGADGLVIYTTPNGLFNGGIDGAIWKVVAVHVGGHVGAEATIKGESGGPQIISQNSVGTATFTFSISGNSVQLACSSGSFTTNWRAYRLI